MERSNHTIRMKGITLKDSIRRILHGEVRRYSPGGKGSAPPIGARFTLGDKGFLSEGKQVPTFAEYAQGWLTGYAELQCKPSTARSYEQLLRVHLTPHFGRRKVTDIKRDEIKQFLSQLGTGHPVSR
jgi:Phage integrase, N-terminal SAM-like domain